MPSLIRSLIIIFYIESGNVKYKPNPTYSIMKAFILLQIVCLLTAFSPAYAATVPGGMVASYNNGTSPGTELEVTITIENEPRGNSSYFWAQMFYMDSNKKLEGYFGIQTGGSFGDRIVRKMFIFSIWNAIDAEAGPGASAQPFEELGTGYSVKLPYRWKQGVPYHFRLRKDEPISWRLTFSEPGKDEIYLGRIFVPEVVKIKPQFTAFTEYFRSLDNCADLPRVRAVFSDMLLDKTPVPAYSAINYGNCKTRAKGFIQDGAAVHEVNE